MNNNFFFQETFIKNPVLIGTVGLCPVVAICTSLKSALIMSAITILTLIIAQALSSLLFKKLPQWLRMGLYTLVGMAIVIPSIFVIEKISPTAMLAFGIYLPLLAVNPIIVRQCEREAVNSSLGKSIVTAICAGIGYSIVLIVVGFVREILGTGTIFGFDIAILPPAAGFLMPMGGFLVLAYMAAALRAYFRKIDPEFSDGIALVSRGGAKVEKRDKTELLKADTTLKKPARIREKKPDVVKTPSGIEVVTLEQAEEAKAKAKPQMDSTIQAEFAQNKPLPDNAKVTHKTSQFEFITLDLSSERKSSAEAEAFAAAVAASTATVPQKQRSKRNQSKKVKEEAPRRLSADRKREPRPTEKEEAPAEKVETPVERVETPVEKVKAPADRVETPAEKSKSSAEGPAIVYKSDELERLMSMSLDDIINSLPSESEEGGEK